MTNKEFELEIEQVQPEQQKLSNSKAVIAYLAECFPKCFTIKGDALPLKIGIFDDLSERLKDDGKVSKTRLRTALRQYTNSWRYLRVIKAGHQRVDLDGAEAGVIEAEHEQHAQETLVESKAKARKAQQNTESADTPNVKGVKKDAGQTKLAASVTKKSEAKPRFKRAAGASNKVSVSNKAKNTPTKKVDVSKLEIGQKVGVKVGSTPMVATVTTVDKTEAQVQLSTGMTLKVSLTELYEV